MKLRPTRVSHAPRGATIVLAAALAAGPLALVAATAAAETVREASEKTVEVRGFSGLEVQNARGRINVRAGAPGRVRISALKTVRALGDATARELSDQTLVETGVGSGLLTVRVRYPQRRSITINLWEGFSSGDYPRSDVRLLIEVPPSFPVTLRSSSGDQTTESLRGTQSLSSSSGDVTVAGSAGAVEIRTASGDVVIDGARAPVRVSTTSGDVEVPSASDSLTIETTSGDVQIEAARGGVVINSSSGEVVVRGAARRVRIGTASGEIHAGLLAPLLGARLTSASGDVVAELDDRLGCTLDVRTSSGSIDLDVPVRTRTVSRRVVTATVGNGATPVEVQSVSGDITITGRNR